MLVIDEAATSPTPMYHQCGAAVLSIILVYTSAAMQPMADTFFPALPTTAFLPPCPLLPAMLLPEHLCCSLLLRAAIVFKRLCGILQAVRPLPQPDECECH